jgi:Ca2+-binding RTX toxin-like protein
VLDLDGDGVELTSQSGAGAVYWDIDNDGFAEASGWVDSDDGVLAIDLDEDGIINNSAELFGGQTGYANGFLTLAAHDSNQDGVITEEDAVWDNLLVWIDNGDGYSEVGELYTLDDLLITEIDLGYSDVSYTIAGNDVLQKSSFTMDGNSRDIVDAYFAFDNLNSVYSQTYTLELDTLLLPILRGSGELSDLYIAMSLDNTGTGNLLDLVSDLADLSFANVFDETTDILDDVKDIMFRWAGVDSLTGDERGNFVDSRELGFVEKMTGQDFVQRGVWTDPQRAEAGEDLNEAFKIALNNVYARLLAQSAGGELFTGDFYYDIATDSFSGITGLDSTNLAALETEATGLADTGEREVFWSNVLRMVEFSVGVSNLPSGDQTALSDAIYDSDNSLDMNDLIDGLDYARNSGVDESYTSGDDTETGSSADDIMDGLGGDDDLDGLAGNDVIDAGADDDVLTGGTGGDYLLGDLGEDDYMYDPGDGEDTIQERGTGTGNDADQIIFGSGIDSGDLTFTRMGNTDLLIDIDTGTYTGRIIIEDQFNYSAGGGHVEEIEFSDMSTYDLDGQAWTLNGTSGDDDLDGVTAGGLDTDTINGLGGNDDINGGDGADTLNGGDGDDTIDGGAGADTIDGGADDDYIDAGAGDDDITMGSGDDEARGGADDDTYRYSGGHDVIYDTSGSADVIRLDASWGSVTPDYYKESNDLRIVWDGDNDILIENFFVGSNEVETMIYDDTTSVTLDSVRGVAGD